ncbi:sigma-54-dependent Fis family transcriptional regulator [Vibrio cholerae]|uniref:sigma-54-dependent Fis family transcriptional regulator n=1 Tax=Vibrio cholerae TaxID=666 RepID=UPI0013C313AD|nr:sigma-54-dependent Fis family transcriptional regulator [Vibrio cholerae]
MQLQQLSHVNWLVNSWQRSEQAGLTQQSRAQDIRLSDNKLKERRQELAGLIDTVSRFALPLFYQLFAHSDSRLILTDQHGVIIGSWGQARFREKLSQIALSSGACWQEPIKGTNAIGTALIEQKPISVIGEQHFIQHHHFISCSASPIFDYTGQLIGVLDITSEQQKHTLSTQVVVQNMVQLVENQLLNQIPHGHVRIDLACEPSLLSSGWQGVIIADESGQILAHNQVAGQLLAQGRVIGQSVEQVLPRPQTHASFIYTTTPHHSKQHRTRALTPASDLHFGDAEVERCWQQANRVIDKDIRLLILGQTGVGKNEFVKALHKNSQRKNGPLVAVNCGALAKELVEAELFGYVAGAFTGASHKGYQGKVRLADKGILFLDEIADLPLDAQSRLLHVLQDKTVLPVGSNPATKVDIQIIAAPHKNLEQLVTQGLFRQDLYYRLSDLVVELPSFQQRQDRQALIHHIHRRYRDAGQQICGDLMQRLLAYHWPGNLRELDSLIKVASLMAEGEGVLTFNPLPTHLAQKLSHAAPTATEDDQQKDIKSTVEASLLKTYQATQGNISQTSRLLGLSRNTIYRKLKALGILK